MTAATASAGTIHGHVLDDAKQPITGATVAFAASAFTTTDSTGAYDLTVPDDTDGFVWLHVPEGFEPHPVWGEWSGGIAPIDLVAKRLAKPFAKPLRFVLGSDAHVGLATFASASDLATAIAEMTAGDPAFLAILGDVTQGGIDPEFDQVGAALSALGDVPWIPVPGNHDWYDNGVVWGKRIGPDNYSFDLGGVHFLVWNMALDDRAIFTLLRGDLDKVALPIVALTHAPPSPQVLRELARLHVTYVLTGHAHSNRVVDHAGLVEINSEPLLMGGLDFTPAGYRTVVIDHGVLTSQHHVTVDRSLLSIIAPEHGQCARTHGELVVAAELDAGTPAITARIDGATPITLRWVGGWDWRAELPTLTSGNHEVVVTAISPTGLTATARAAIEVCDPPPPARIGADWNQLGGGPTHAGTTEPLSTTLAPHWVTPVGGHILSAAPAIAKGVVFVTVTDLADGNTGGVVAIDLVTGRIKWRAATPIQVRGGVAVIGDVVVVPRIDGTVLGLDAATGAERWSRELRAGTVPEAAATFASVAADGDDVMIGHQRAFAVLDAADGHSRWHTDPVPEGENSQSLAAVAIGDNTVVGTFNRAFGGVQAWDRSTGAPQWQLDSDDTVGINATPVIANHTVFVVNAADSVTAISLATGEVSWRAALDPDGFAWGNATIATPAYAHGTLIVPTLYRDVVALDAATGAERWRHAALPSPIRTTHYRGGGGAGYEASPVIAGGLVWIADTSGELAALELETGAPRFRATIGAPVLAGLAASGDYLVVASFDGTVRAFAPAPLRKPHATTPYGCSTTTPDFFVVLVVLGFLLKRARI